MNNYSRIQDLFEKLHPTCKFATRVMNVFKPNPPRRPFFEDIQSCFHYEEFEKIFYQCVKFLEAALDEELKKEIIFLKHYMSHLIIIKLYIRVATLDVATQEEKLMVILYLYFSCKKFKYCSGARFHRVFQDTLVETHKLIEIDGTISLSELSLFGLERLQREFKTPGDNNIESTLVPSQVVKKLNFLKKGAILEDSFNAIQNGTMLYFPN